MNGTETARPRSPWLLLTVLFLGVLHAGCKEGNPIGGGISLATAGFIEEARPGDVTERFVYLRASSMDDELIVLDVVVTEVDEPVIGIAVKLSYPSSFSKFVDCGDGELFPPGNCYFAEPEPGSGEVFISRVITHASQATPVVGEQVIARVEFLVFGIDLGPIVIEGQNLGGGDTSALLDTENNPIFVQWYSGTITGE